MIAEREIPSAEYYGDFCQLENGVGLWRLMLDEAMEGIEFGDAPEKTVDTTLVTGVSAAPLIRNIVDIAALKWHNLNCRVYEVKNDFFGHNITVAGLITGGDIINQLSGKPLGERLLIPDVMLRHENDCFLDDVTVQELQERLSVRVEVIGSDANSLIAALKGE